MFVRTHPSNEQLERYILRQLSPDHEIVIEEHYLICAYCQKRITQLETPEFYELVAALRSTNEEAPELIPKAAASAPALLLVPRPGPRPARMNTLWLGVAAAAAVIFFGVAGLRLASKHRGAPVARMAGAGRTAVEATPGFALKPSPEVRQRRSVLQRYGSRSRRYIRSVPQVQVAARCVFHPPAALRPIITEPVLDLDLQILAVADIQEPLQFDLWPEPLPAPRKSPWRKFFAVVRWPFRHILSQAE